ncbi:Siderophore transporter, RhtX/FptX family [Lasiodiplodia theobromae]|uniref:Siderophore transporter, RhtX/FptX family n=1 Tax=Lasiodiplodia theobromae TaxID=45133 RepID=UPI0015C339A0|nr:Siderophore transporter, RhtX/FptX family [Lasiodiplodia theobromae]KAF4546140.1 Siderophore transporter, RhtX/FptX family [Lasiodiplodia theobromae]
MAEPRNTSATEERRDGASSDLEKQQIPSSGVASESGESDAQVTEKPGARVGLTLTQFWIVIVALNMGMLLTALDFNIVATAVPIISSDFKEYSNSSWLGTGFLISFALVLPIYSKLGDMFGRKNMFLLGTLIFTLGSGLCGGSSSMSMLIASRLIQGIGAGGIYGLVNVIVTDLVPLREVGKYLALAGLVWAIADVAGPLLGGAFSQYVSWRWCFYINLCIAPVTFVVIFIVLKLPAPKLDFKKLKNYDYLGTLTLCGGTTCLLLGLSWGGNNFPWSDSRVIGCLVGGPALLAAFVVVEHYAKDPLIFPSMLRSRTIIAILVAEFFYGANLLGLMYYVPQFFQLVFGDSATLSGVGLLPMMLGLAIGNPIAAVVTSKFGISLYNAVAGAGLEILASGLMTRWNEGTSRAEAVIVLIILGIGQGAVMSGLLLSSQVAVPPMQIGIVTGLVIFMQTIGDIFGIAMFAAAYVNELSASLARLDLTQEQITLVLTDVQEVKHFESADLKHEVVEVYADSMRNGWWLMFACACMIFVASLCSRQHKFGAK